MKDELIVFKKAPREYFNLIPQAGVTHLLCKEFPTHNAVWDMTVSEDGRIFFSVCGESFCSEYARLYEYDRKAGRLIHHFNLEDKIIERENTLRTSKFHTALSFMEDGRIITTTHTTSPSPLHPTWMPYQYANHQWEGYPGSSILVYDPKSGTVEGKGIISPYDTTYGGTYCPKTGDYFCTTWMRGTGYVYNVRTGEHRCLGQVSDVATSRTLLCSDGHIYGSTYSGKMFRYNSDTRELEYLDADIKALMRHSREHGGKIYILTGPCGNPARSQNLYTYDLSDGRVEDLGRIVPSVEKLDPNNDSYFNAYGLDFDSKGRLWYTCMGYCRVPGRQFEWCSRLYMWDIKNGKAPIDLGIIGSKERSIVVTAEFRICEDVIYVSDGNHSNTDDLYCGIMAIDIEKTLAALDTEERTPSHDFINYMPFERECAAYYPKDDFDSLVDGYYAIKHPRMLKMFKTREDNAYVTAYPEKRAISYWEAVGRENTRVNKIEWRGNGALSVYCGTKRHFRVDYDLATDAKTVTPCEARYQNEIKATVPDGVGLPYMMGRQYLAEASASVEMPDGSLIVGTRDMMLAKIQNGRVKSLGAVTPCGGIASLVSIGNTVYGIAGHEMGFSNMFKYDDELGVIQLGYVPTEFAKGGRNVCIFKATTLSVSPDGKRIAVGGADELSGVIVLTL